MDFFSVILSTTCDKMFYLCQREKVSYISV